MAEWLTPGCMAVSPFPVQSLSRHSVYENPSYEFQLSLSKRFWWLDVLNFTE